MSKLEIGNFIKLPTEYGNFEVRYTRFINQEAVILSNLPDENSIVNLRLHSSCVFSESFHSTDCDCSHQLADALKIIGERTGVVIYFFDEGRGVGLKDKINAIKLQQEKGINTAEAFKILGFSSDERSFEFAVEILNELFKTKEFKLITNNPRKVEKLKKAGFKIIDVIKTIHPKNEVIREYLHEKKDHLGHNIEFDE